MASQTKKRGENNTKLNNADVKNAIIGRGKNGANITHALIDLGGGDMQKGL